jgi:hypothetical protein
MRVLHLTLKKKWFDMIASGEKKEEYREIKKYWCDRLAVSRNLLDGCRDFYAVEFKNGYAKDSRKMLVRCEEIDFGMGRQPRGRIFCN